MPEAQQSSNKGKIPIPRQTFAVNRIDRDKAYCANLPTFSECLLMRLFPKDLLYHDSVGHFIIQFNIPNNTHTVYRYLH